MTASLGVIAIVVGLVVTEIWVRGARRQLRRKRLERLELERRARAGEP